MTLSILLFQIIVHFPLQNEILLARYRYFCVHRARPSSPGQCGGLNPQGETTCTSGHTCVEYNAYYSQCVQSNNANPVSPSSTAATTLITRISTPSATPTASSSKPAAPTSSPVVSSTHGEQCSIDAKFKSAGKKYLPLLRTRDCFRMRITRQ